VKKKEDLIPKGNPGTSQGKFWHCLCAMQRDSHAPLRPSRSAHPRHSAACTPAALLHGVNNIQNLLKIASAKKLVFQTVRAFEKKRFFERKKKQNETNKQKKQLVFFLLKEKNNF